MSSCNLTTPLTRTKQTDEAYWKRFEQLVRQFERAHGREPDEDSEFVMWLVEHVRPTLAKSSWRQYKASVKMVLQANSNSGHPDAIYALSILNQAGQQECIKTTTRTSAAKAKCLNLSDYQLLLEGLSRTSSRYANVAKAIFILGLMTGLRPGEWIHAEYVVENGISGIRVRNAKATNGRATGEFRFIPFPVGPHARLAQRLISTCRRWQITGDYNKKYKSMSSLFRRTARKIWPNDHRRATLYTSRHIFSAAMKAALPGEEVSNLLGHCSEDTKHRHYARRSRSALCLHNTMRENFGLQVLPFRPNRPRVQRAPGPE
ncbi:hypothetical protein [Iodidimonas muriae]|uniref:hypothetical protein n=1 Tax=Iodidimonas muriae TaxID=261467 RepID=UPI001230A904|nr:hypothetical protein [Iodidimonas muriae]